MNFGARSASPTRQVSEMALHFCERHGLMVVKCPSKFEIARLCKLTGATSLARFGAPLPEEIGSADRVSVDEIGGQKCTTFNRESQESTKVRASHRARACAFAIVCDLVCVHVCARA